MEAETHGTQHSALSTDLEFPACLLCGADEPVRLYSGRDYMLGLPGEFGLNRCRRCGLVYQSPRPRDLTPYYGGGYVSHSQGARRSPLARLRAAVQRRGMVAYVQRHSGRAGGRVLDVGCGTGTFLAALRGAGWDVWGVEPGAQAAAAARAALGPQIFAGTLEDLELPQRTFDLVTMWDVIEHLPNPAVTLERVRALLAPGGVLLVQTPRWGCFESRLFGQVWSGLDCPRHLAVFSGHTLTQLLAQSGLAARPIPALSSSFQSWALSLRYAAARRWGSAAGARLYRLLASPPTRLASWPLIAALDQGAYPAQLAFAATIKPLTAEAQSLALSPSKGRREQLKIALCASASAVNRAASQSTHLTADAAD